MRDVEREKKKRGKRKRRKERKRGNIEAEMRSRGDHNILKLLEAGRRRRAKESSLAEERRFYSEENESLAG